MVPTIMTCNLAFLIKKKQAGPIIFYPSHKGKVTPIITAPTLITDKSSSLNDKSSSLVFETLTSSKGKITLLMRKHPSYSCLLTILFGKMILLGTQMAYKN